MRRLASLFAPVLLLCTALLSVAGGPLASAAITDTTVNFTCIAHAPIVGDQTVAQQLTFSTDAPSTVEANSNFNVVVSPGTITVPASMSGVNVNSITNVKMRIPVSPNAQFISGSASGGSNYGAAATVALVGGNIEVTMPGPLNGGTTVTPPTITTVMKATGAVGSTIDAHISDSASPKGYTMTVNTSVGAVPTECTPDAPNPSLATATIVDTAAPTVNFNTPANGAGYGLGATVAASYSCDDHGGSGVASCVGDVANGANIDTSTLGAHSFTVTTADNSGNSTTQTINYNVVVPSGDTTPPTITITAPTNGSLYTQGQAVAAAYSCSDDIAMGACTGTVANGANIDTSSSGPKTFTVNATDAAGNTASQTVGYYVSGSGTTVTGPKDAGNLTASGSSNVNGAKVWVRVTAPAANGGDVPVGSTLHVEYEVYKGTSGFGSNGGPDPVYWTLSAPSNAVITGNVVVDTNGMQGENASSAYKNPGNVGLKSLTPANPQSNGSSITVEWDGRSYPGGVGVDDGILIHVAFDALVTAPGTVTIKGFDGLTGTDPTFPAGPFSTDGRTDAQIGIAYNAIDITPPTITINSPINGSLYSVGQVVNADFSCADNVGVATCTGTVANGSPVDTSTSGPHSFQVTSTDAAGNTAISTVSYSVAAPTVDISGCTVNETQNCVFTVTLSNASGQNVAVNYDTSDGTAVAGVRYTATSGVLNFAPGETSKTISVPTLNVGGQQPDQSFTVTLSAPVAATLGIDTATGTVHDTSPTPLLIGGYAEVHRGFLNQNDVTVSVPVVLSNAVGQPTTSGYTVTAQYHTTDWSAHAPGDYTPTSGTLTYLPGENVKYVDVTVPYTALAQLNRIGLVFVDHIVNAVPGGFTNTTLDDPFKLTMAGFGIITDTPWQTLSVNPVTANIPAGTTQLVTFTVTQAGANSDDLRGVTFATVDGTAVGGTDFDARSGLMLWAPNATYSRTVGVWVHPTGAPGTTKTFQFELSNPGGPMTLNATKYIATATINIT